jgi:hypothetical protein
MYFIEVRRFFEAYSSLVSSSAFVAVFCRLISSPVFL